jgi:hypothetical protein
MDSSQRTQHIFPYELNFYEVTTNLVLPSRSLKSLSFLSFISATTQGFYGVPAHTLCGIYNNLWLLNNSRLCALPAIESFNHSLGLENSKTSNGLHTPCVTLCYPCTSAGIRTTLSLLRFLSEIKLKVLSTHSLRTFTSLLVGIIRKRNN